MINRDEVWRANLREFPPTARWFAWEVILAGDYPLLNQIANGIYARSWADLQRLLLPGELELVEHLAENVDMLPRRSDVTAAFPETAGVRNSLLELLEVGSAHLSQWIERLDDGPEPDEHVERRSRQFEEFEDAYQSFHYENDPEKWRPAERRLKRILAEIFLVPPRDIGGHDKELNNPLSPAGGRRAGARRSLPTNLAAVFSELCRLLDRVEGDERIALADQRLSAIEIKFRSVLGPRHCAEELIGLAGSIFDGRTTPAGLAKRMLALFYRVDRKAIDRRLANA